MRFEEVVSASTELDRLFRVNVGEGGSSSGSEAEGGEGREAPRKEDIRRGRVAVKELEDLWV